jgi:hypothetical protein
MSPKSCRLLWIVCLFGAGLHLQAQDDDTSGWFARSDAAKASQPHWMTPLVTVTPRLEQEFRTDFLVEQMATGDDLVNFGGGKGLELIPNERVEVLMNVPPYLEHNNPKIDDGFGDASFVGKYRLLSGNEDNGQYIVTVFLGATIPTGSHTNGARGGVITPTLAAGKGWGRFDIQSTLGAGLPTSHVQTIGHAIAWNTTFQYHVANVFWPELEVNSTFWKDGTQNSKKQTFLTPGVILGRFRVHGRVRMAFGAGFQTATTHYHTYNHATVITIRFPF